MTLHPDFRSSAEFLSSGLSSSPVRTNTGVFAPGPAAPSAGTAGAAPPPAPATFLRPPAAGAASVIRTEDGTVILFDRATGRAVSGLTRQAAEAALLRLEGRGPA